MVAASRKADLLAVTLKEWEKLAKLLDEVPETLATLPDSAGDSIKSVVSHRAHWIKLFFGWYGDGQAGREVFIPAKGYKWNDLKRYNAELRARQADMSWQKARSLLDGRHGELVALLEQMDDAALYGGPMKGGKNHWTTGRWAEAAGASAYRSAAKYIRARMRA